MFICTDVSITGVSAAEFTGGVVVVVVVVVVV